jgi:hypothetical protein
MPSFAGETTRVVDESVAVIFTVRLGRNDRDLIIELSVLIDSDLPPSVVDGVSVKLKLLLAHPEPPAQARIGDIPLKSQAFRSARLASDQGFSAHQS